MIKRVKELLSGTLSPTPLVLKVLLVGLAVRFLLAPWTSFPYDTYPFYGAAVGTLAGTGPYGNVLFTYPPLFAVIIYPFVAILYQFIDPSNFGMFVPSMVDVSRMTGMMVPFVTSPLFNLMYKVPLIAGDVLVGLTIFRVVRSWKGVEQAEKAFLIWFLNPLVIFISSVHGQFDVLPAFCALVGMLAFIDRRYMLSGTALGLGVLLKIFPIYLIIVCLVSLAISLFRGMGEGKGVPALRSLLLFLFGGLLSLLSILPFILSSSSFLEYVMRRGTYTSVGGLNLWFISPFLRGLSDGTGSGGAAFPFGTAVLLMGIVLTVIASIIILRRKVDDERGRILFATVVAMVIILVTQAVTNPQYLIWLFPPLILLSLDSPRILNKLYWLSVIGLVYVLSLQSGFVFVYPMAQYLGWPPTYILNQGISVYFVGTGYVRSLLLGILGGAGAAVLLTILLPSRLDIFDWINKRIGSWRDRHAS